MKKVQCIIRPSKLEEVKSALAENGIFGITITEVRGCGKQKGFTQTYRVSEVTINLLPKIELEIVVKEEDLEKCVNVILKSAKTGEIGDGKIFIFPIEEVIRIRTEERGNSAI